MNTQNGEGIEAKDGCTYTLDAAFDGAYVAQGVTAQTVESGGKTLVSWSHSQALAESGLIPFALVMNTSCPEEDPVSMTSCTPVKVQ